MKNTLYFIVALTFLFSSCGSENNTSAVKDTLSAKDSVKKLITETLPPDDDFKQFEWIYSSFVAASTYNVKSADVFIDKEAGLWVINSDGAMPTMVHVNSMKGVLNYKNDTLIPIDGKSMVCELKNEEIAKPDCDAATFWSKNGCFTTSNNTFKEERIWDYAGLTDDDAKKVEELSVKINRVVMNTSLNMKMYFMLKNGSWYLVFLDLRQPCSA
jgi:hypothetical protein